MNLILKVKKQFLKPLFYLAIIEDPISITNYNLYYMY